MLAVIFALILLLIGGFIFTQGGTVPGAIFGGIGAVIILIKVFA